MAARCGATLGTLAAYAEYLVKFLPEGTGHPSTRSRLIRADLRHYCPSCLWDKTTYTNFVGRHLGPALAARTRPKIMPAA